MLTDVLILQVPDDVHRGDASNQPRSNVGRAPYHAIAILFHCAYVSESFYLSTRAVLNIAGIPTSRSDSRSPLADLECAHMPIELNCSAVLHPLSITAEYRPGRRIGVLAVLGMVGVTSCVSVAGLTTALSL